LRGRIAGGSSTAHRRLHSSEWGAGVVLSLRTVVRLPQRPWERTSERANEARSASEGACAPRSSSYTHLAALSVPGSSMELLSTRLVYTRTCVMSLALARQKPGKARFKFFLVEIHHSPCLFQSDAVTVTQDSVCQVSINTQKTGRQKTTSRGRFQRITEMEGCHRLHGNPAGPRPDPTA